MKVPGGIAGKKFIIIISILVLLLIAAIVVFALTHAGGGSDGSGGKPDISETVSPSVPSESGEPVFTDVPETPSPDISPAESSTAEPLPSPSGAENSEASASPQHDASAAPTENSLSSDSGSEKSTVTAASYTLTFLGDCIFSGSDISSTIFSSALGYTTTDDFTIANLECTLDDSTPPTAAKPYIASTSSAQYLADSGIDFVNLANTHTMDCGLPGYLSTKDAVSSYGISYIEDWDSSVYTTASGLKIGVYSSNGYVGSNIKQSIASLRSSGAQIVIACISWNTDDTNSFIQNEYYGAHYAADCGADIIFGQGVDSVQPLEHYKNSFIIYSLGTLSNCYSNSIRDTAILQIKIHVNDDGSLSFDETTSIPCSCASLNSDLSVFASGSEGYYRILSKLNSVDSVFGTSSDSSASPSESSSPSPQPYNNTTGQ